MTWIKICGITNLEDALTAVDAGADALGFVFYEKSPRNIAPDVAREIVARLPGPVEKVGVFVHGCGPDPVDVASQVGLTAIQNGLGSLPGGAATSPQGAVGLAGLARAPKLYLSFPADWFFGDVERIKNLAESLVHFRWHATGRFGSSVGWLDTFFLDSSNLQLPGGTGVAFDWEKAASVAEGMRERGFKLVVAGGLTPSNVPEAMHKLKPWGVDVSSGVEAQPGRKDPEKIRAFVVAVRGAEKVA